MHTHYGFRVVVIGDDCIGKTSLVHRCVYGDFSAQYAPTARDDYIIRRRISDDSSISQRISLDICDTGGQGVLDRLRPLCYSKADVIILCFSVVNPSSFKNITDKWMPEIQRHAQADAPFLLVGTQADLRSNINVLLKLSENGHAPLPESRAMRLAQKIGAAGYIESSALTSKNINEIFDLSLILSLQRLERNRRELPDILEGHYQQKVKQRSLKRSTCIGKDLDGLKKNGNNKFCNNNNKGPGVGNATINSVASKLFSRQWRQKKSLRLKRLLFLSCLPH